MEPTKGRVWEAKTPLTTVCVRNDWFTCPGKFMPFSGGCGIHCGVDTLQEAKQIITEYLKIRKQREIERLESRLEELKTFNPENL